MSNEAKGLMISRDDVVRLSHNIARAIPATFLEDSKRPLNIAVNGSYGCGKKLISDSLIEGLTGVDPHPLKFANGWTPETKDEYRAYLKARAGRGYIFSGKEGKDEFVTVNNPAGQKLDLMFLDLNYEPRMFEFCRGWGEISTAETIELFNMERENGGFTVIQNSDNLKIDGCENDFKADVEIWLESENSNFNNEPLRCPQLKQKLFDAFGEASTESNWGRYCEVKLRNTDPALVPVIQAAQAALIKVGV